MEQSLRREIGSARSSVRFRFYEAVTGWMLVRMAKIAAKRLDLHELEHISAQMEVGESVDCGHVRAMANDAGPYEGNSGITPEHRR